MVGLYGMVQFVLQFSHFLKYRSPSHRSVREYPLFVGAVPHVEPVFKALGHKFPFSPKVMDGKHAFVEQGRDQHLVVATPLA